MQKAYVPSLLGLALALSNCKSTGNVSHASSQEIEVSPSGDTESLFDVNDVSLLYPSPKVEEIASYIHFADKTAEGVIFPKELFAQSAKLADINEKFSYESFAVSGIRIDNCAKLLLQLPCTPQLRLVFQNVEDASEGIQFGDQTIHLPFNIEPAKEMQLYKDFLELKLSALPLETKGPLEVHPVLLKEGAKGQFAQKLKTLIAKYALVSKIERVAVMGTAVTGTRATWTFGASQPIKDGKIVATPIPCQSGEVKNMFSSTTRIAPVPTMPTKFLGEVSPEVKNCGNLDATALIHQTGKGKLTLEGEERTTAINNALAINDPSKVFFASTTCVNCHLASRRLDFSLGQKFLTEKDGNPLRFQAPDDVTSVYKEAPSAGGGNTWNLRAFGWNETATGVAVSLYTFNDTMRVAHELNELIRAGKLK